MKYPSDKLFLVSDVHFNHKNIIDYCKRPFSSVQEMNEMLIKNWNEKVPPDGIVFDLGDHALGGDVDAARNFTHRLNGEIHLILGNHDQVARKGFLNLFKNKEFLHSNKSFYNIQEIYVEDEEMGLTQTIVLSHFPLEVWHHNHHGSWHLHGHCHGTLPSGNHQARLDVGVDVQQYAPISYAEVKKIMTKKVFKPVDHHGARPVDGK